jgi:GNAT superfamily N-acetyltransferase
VEGIARRGPRPLSALAGSLDLGAFDCGEPSLNEWLARRALNAEGGMARTYVLAEERSVVAYYCLSAGAVERAAWPGRFRRNAPDPIPVIILGRLAVAKSAQGRGLGQDLMQHALRQFLAATRFVGARALVVHTLNEKVAGYYGRLGFQPFASGPEILFLPRETILAGAAADAGRRS